MSSNKPNFPRVALVYDHLLTGDGGAEQVLQALLTAFPEAPLFTTMHDPAQADWIDSKRVVTAGVPSWLQYFLRNREVLSVISPYLLEMHDFSEYDVVFSVTTTAAKGVLTTPKQLHVSYVLSPPRYLYHQAAQLLADHPIVGLPGFRQLAELTFSYLRWWDTAATARPDVLYTLSQVVADRITTIYGRSTKLLAPPVQAVERRVIPALPPFILSLGRLVAYKRVDLAIAAAVSTQSFLVVAGTGRELSRLQTQAGSSGWTRDNENLETAFSLALKQNKHVVFLGRVSEEEKATLLSQMSALVLPGIEDFSITALEAVLLQKPVLLHAESGAAELLKKNECVLLTEQSVAAVRTGLAQINTVQITANRAKELADQLTVQEFVRKVHKLVFSL